MAIISRTRKRWRRTAAISLPTTETSPAIPVVQLCSMPKLVREPYSASLWCVAGQPSAKPSAAMKPRCTARRWNSITPRHRARSTGSMSMWRTIITGMHMALTAARAHMVMSMKKRCTATVQTAVRKARFLCRSSPTFCLMVSFRWHRMAHAIPRITRKIVKSPWSGNCTTRMQRQN